METETASRKSTSRKSVKQSTSVRKSTPVKQSTSKDLTDATGQRVVLDDRSSFIVDRDEDDEAMEVDEQEEIVVEKLENEPADLNKVASNLTNSFIAAGRALSQGTYFNFGTVNVAHRRKSGRRSYARVRRRG